jgi:2-dehydropantoate 2-reductase
MRLGVLGVGGVGGFFGGLLARGGLSVRFVARGAHFEVLRGQGLTLRTPGGTFTLPVDVTDDVSSIAPVDALLLCVKTYDVPAFAPLLPELLAPDGVVVTLMNGIESERLLAPALSPERVLLGIPQVIASLVEPGMVAQTGGAGELVVGEAVAGSGRAEAFASLCVRAGVACRTTSDVRRAQWEKFVSAASLLGALTLARAPLPTLLRTVEGRAMLEQAMAEVHAVGCASGIGLAADLVSRVMNALERHPPDGAPSMLRDLYAGRPLELDALSGKVVRLGRTLGIPTPMHLAIVASLRPHASGIAS